MVLRCGVVRCLYPCSRAVRDAGAHAAEHGVGHLLGGATSLRQQLLTYIFSREMSKRRRKRIQSRLMRANRRRTTRPAGREGRPPERGLRRRAAPPPRPAARQARRREANTALHGTMMHVVRRNSGVGCCSLGVAYRAIPAGLPVLLARINSEL